MKNNEYPSLFAAADRTAAKKQSLYFKLLRLQYLSLFVASAVTLFTIWYPQKSVLLVYIAALVIGSVAALLLATLKPHQHWYQMRALAESCKTLAWRYMMLSEPFHDQADASRAGVLLSDRLIELVSIQGLDKTALLQNLEVSDQATEEMKMARSLPFKERKAAYLSGRIDNQLSWYKHKAAQNKRLSTVSSGLVVLVYVVAIIVAIAQVEIELFRDQVLWVSEPLLVLAASFLGYAQAKRFAELSSSYALTALEIQKLRSGFLLVESDAALAEYVNEAETAFSREHTQWIARVV